MLELTVSRTHTKTLVRLFPGEDPHRSTSFQILLPRNITEHKLWPQFRFFIKKDGILKFATQLGGNLKLEENEEKACFQLKNKQLRTDAGDSCWSESPVDRGRFLSVCRTERFVHGYEASINHCGTQPTPHDGK